MMVHMGDRLRPLAYHLFLAAILGGLWLYADLRRRADQTRPHYPVTSPRLVQRSAEVPPGGAAEPTTRPAGPMVSDLGLFGDVSE